MAKKKPIELPACPCCGGKARLYVKRGHAGITASKYYREYVYCGRNSCGVRTKVYKYPGKAVEAWEKRQ